MRKRSIAAACLALFGSAAAQSPTTPERLSDWKYFKEIALPNDRPRLVRLSLDRETLDAFKDDASDLRLYDSAGHEIPHALRVRREINTQEAVDARIFDTSVENGSARASCDLGEKPQEHNEVAIETAGNNFRRLVDVQGSPDGSQWFTLVSEANLFRFTAGGRTVEQMAVDYPVSRYRYLRVRLSRDPQVERAAPVITNLRVRRSIQAKGEKVQFAGRLELREADRVEARPASVWQIDLGARIPFEQIVLTVAEEEFARSFQLYAVDNPQAPELIASGQLSRRRSEKPKLISFEENAARRLKLTILDDRNPPLNLTSAYVLSAARQLIFETASVAPGPIRLYYGNPKALPPHYDLGARVPLDPAPGPPVLIGIAGQQNNPAYLPEPKPFLERLPFLAYLILSVVILVLAALLMGLVRVAKQDVSTRSPANG
jgi:hypothetical protein